MKIRIEVDGVHRIYNYSELQNWNLVVEDMIDTVNKCRDDKALDHAVDQLIGDPCF